MASLEEEYRARLAGPGVGQSVVDVFDTTRGITDDIYNANVAKNIGGNAPTWFKKEGVDIPEEPNVPTLDVVLSKLGVKADNDPTGVKSARKFVDEFASKQGIWKKKIVKDPELGERGWETVKDIFKQTANDLREYDTAEGRKKAMHDGSLIGGLANIMFPRAVKAGEEGRDPEPNEWVRDAVSNVAYALPMGSYSAVLTRGLPAIAKIGAQGLSQAVVPSAVAGMDYALDKNYDLGDAQVDALTGTLANLGVNKALGPALGRSVGIALGKVSSRVPPNVRAILEGQPSVGELARETVTAAERDIANASKPFTASGLRKGINPVSKGRLTESEAIRDVAEAAGKTLTVKPGQVLTAPEVLTSLETALKNKPIKGSPVNVSSMNENDIVGAVVQQLQHPKTSPTFKKPTPSKEFREGAKKYSKILAAHPELKTMFVPEGNLTPEGIVKSAAAYGVNQYGTSSNAADIASASLPGIDLKKNVSDNRKRKEKSATRVATSQVLSAPGVTGEDAAYLKMVQDNPDILKFSQDPDFKMWLLKRGHRLLQGTAAHRPLWEVK